MSEYSLEIGLYDDCDSDREAAKVDLPGLFDDGQSFLSLWGYFGGVGSSHDTVAARFRYHRKTYNFIGRDFE